MLHKNLEYYTNPKWTVSQAAKEIKDGLKLLGKVDQKIVSFFGSHKDKIIITTISELLPLPFGPRDAGQDLTRFRK